MEDIKTAEKQSERGSLLGVAGFACLHFVNDMHATILPAVIPMLVSSINLSFTQAGILSGLFGFTHIMGQPISGFLADRQSKPYFAVWGPLLTIVCASMLPMSPNFAIAFITVLFMSMGTALFHPQGVGRAGSAASSANLAFFISLFSACGSFGSAVAPLYIVFLVQTMGTHGAPVVILPALLLCLFFWKRLPSQEPRKHSASENGAGGFLRNVRDVMGKIWTIVFAVSLRDASYQSIRVFLPMLVILKGGTMESGSLTLFFVTLAGTIAGMIGGKLADTVGDRKILLCSIAVAPFFVLAGLLMSGPFALAVLTVGCALLQASSPVTTAMAQRRCAESRSTASSLAMGVSWGIANLFALPVGASADAIGLEPTLYFVAVVPWVVTTFFLFRHEK